MGKLIRRVALGTLILVLVPVVITLWFGITKKGVPGPDALEALAVIDRNEAVEVAYGDWFVIRPSGMEPESGLIIYPGAHADVRAYVQVMTMLAEAGYLVVAPKMPLGYAFLAIDRADDVIAAYPGVKHWFLAGHSLGGAMAGSYAHAKGHKLAGLAFWDAYPPDYSDLSQTTVPTMLLYRATLDGEPEAKFHEKRYLFPATTEWVPIPGGDHKQFGSGQGGMFKEFGMFIRGMDEEEWEATQWKPSISRDEQQLIVVEAMVSWMERTIARGPAPPASAIKR